MRSTGTCRRCTTCRSPWTRARPWRWSARTGPGSQRCSPRSPVPTPGPRRRAVGGARRHRVAAHRRVRLGVSLTPEGRRLFPSLTVEENLQVGGWARDRPRDRARERNSGRAPEHRAGLRGLPARGRRARPARRRAVRRGTAGRGDRPLVAGEPARAAARRGVARPRARDRRPALRVPRRGRGEGAGLLLVEQDLARAMEFCDRMYCLLEGRVVLAGRPDELGRDEVVAAYFGTRTDLRGAS